MKRAIAGEKIMTQVKHRIDRDRTRTCNPQIRSLVPYPLGHTPKMNINFEHFKLRVPFPL